MCGMYFALRSGQEHRVLRFHPSQIELIEKPGERPYLKYTEDMSKNNPGGLKGRKHQPKVVVHHANDSNPTRCFVRIYKLYQSKCPPDRPNNAFYLKPAIMKSTSQFWYTHAPIGHATLAKTVARMCMAAGIPGYKTNHSLRATTATRLYQAGVDEQLIMEKTGHHSLDGVRSYKRTNSEQQEALSDILSLSKKKKLSTSASDTTVNPLEVPTCTEIQPYSSTLQPIQNLHHTNTQQLVIHPDNLKNMFTINNCSDVNIHVNLK